MKMVGLSCCSEILIGQILCDIIVLTARDLFLTKAPSRSPGACEHALSSFRGQKKTLWVVATFLGRSSRGFSRRLFLSLPLLLEEGDDRRGVADPQVPKERPPRRLFLVYLFLAMFECRCAESRQLSQLSSQTKPYAGTKLVPH